MSSKLFQQIVSQMQDTVDRLVGVLDREGTVVACSDLGKIGEVNREPIPRVGGYTQNFTVDDGYMYRAIGDDLRPDYIIFVEGEDEHARQLVNILAITLGSVQDFYNDHFDRADFLKDIILDNILSTDIYQRAKELRFLSDVERVAILFRLPDRVDIAAIDVIQSLFPEKQKDFVVSVSDTDIVLLKECKPDTEVFHLELLARAILEVLDTEIYVKPQVGIGSIISDVRDLNRSFKESQIALEVGKIFDREKDIVSYNTLGVGRLIYQLPTTLCEMYLDEVFMRGSIESLDPETLFTIQKFFENNLNVSETARKLFVHRNTLVYRLEKIRRITGLDLREFDHAIIFKVALMVKKYLTAKPEHY